MAAAQPKIAVVGLRKSFDGKEVLRGIDLQVGDGESLVVVGGSGAGKTVFLKHLIGLLHPDDGHFVVDGIDLTMAEPSTALALRTRFGMSFQEGALFDSMTVHDNIAFPLRRHTDMSPRQVSARVRECLDLVRLGPIEEKAPSELSGGMRRRVGFARAIALEPEILLFDEPTTVLDPINTAAIGGVINEMREELSVTAVTITHDMNLAWQIADRIAMLRRGQIVAMAPPEQFRAIDDEYVQAFLEGRMPAGELEEVGA